MIWGSIPLLLELRRMIRFPCRCGNPIEVPDGEAGGMVQCTKCGLLRDVPTLSDLPGLVGDGTYAMEPAVEETEAQRLEKLRRAFSRGTTDEYGFEIDLRPTAEDLAKVGTEAIPLAEQDERPPEVPKYDPVSGELIEPLKVKIDDRVAPHEIPMAKRAVVYATREQAGRGPGAGAAFLALFQPGNVAVMFFILLIHVLLAVTLLVASVIYVFFFVLAPFMIAVLGAILGHYANVIEEIGPEGRDELPRPLRHAELAADLWWPFVNFTGSLLMCYWPAFFVFGRLAGTPWAWPAMFFMAFAGTVFFPAVLLTLTTSGSSLNLRPDRIMGVIHHAGGRYVVAVLLFPLAAVTYAAGLLGAYAGFLFSFVTGYTRPLLAHPLMAYPLLVTGICLMHYFCWYLGLIYRKEHANFPWVFQRHTPRKLMERSMPGGVRPRPKPRVVAPVRTAEQEARLNELREQERLKMMGKKPVDTGEGEPLGF
jgi:hypothetical protein